MGLALALLLYEQHHGNWLLFLVLILTPDLAMLGYLLGNRTGAACYNAVHTYAFPALLAGVGVAWTQPLDSDYTLSLWADCEIRALRFGDGGT